MVEGRQRRIEFLHFSRISQRLSSCINILHSVFRKTSSVKNEILTTATILVSPMSNALDGRNAISENGSKIYNPGNNPNDPNINYAGASVIDYLTRESRRLDSTVYILNTTPGQKIVIIEYMKGQTTTPNMFPDNCAGRAGNAFQAGGVNLRDLFIPGISLTTTPFPSTIARALDQMVSDGEAGAIFIPRDSVVPSHLSEFDPRSGP